MRVWHDWEFLEDGKTIDPISVGMVTEDGEELYYEFIDAPWVKIYQNEWLVKNVIPGLSEKHNTGIVTGQGNYTVRSRMAIRVKVYDFLKAAYTRGGNSLELWGWYSAYDHVCLAQLFGKMIDLPGWCPMLTMDLKQEFNRLGNPEYPRQTEGLHNALEDAKFMKAKHLWLDQYEKGGRLHDREKLRGFQIGNGNVQNNVF